MESNETTPLGAACGPRGDDAADKDPMDRTTRRTFLRAAAGAALALLPGRSRAATIQPFAPGVHVLSHGYRPSSNQVLDLTGVTLRHADNTGQWNALIDLAGVDNVTIQGGTFDGNVAGQATWREHLHAVSVLSSTNVTIRGATFQNLSGDGVYIAHDARIVGSPKPQHVTVKDCRFTGANTNRNGISVIHGHDIRIEGCALHGMTRPGMPGAIDLEPDTTGMPISDVTITGCTITGQGPVGIMVANGRGAPIDGVVIEHTTIEQHRTGIDLRGNRRVREGVTIRYVDIAKAKIGIRAMEMRPAISRVAYRGCKTRVKRDRRGGGKAR